MGLSVDSSSFQAKRYQHSSSASHFGKCVTGRKPSQWCMVVPGMNPIILAGPYFSIVWQLLENLSQAPYTALSKNLRVALATVLFKYVDVAPFLRFNRSFSQLFLPWSFFPSCCPSSQPAPEIDLGCKFQNNLMAFIWFRQQTGARIGNRRFGGCLPSLRCSRQCGQSSFHFAFSRLTKGCRFTSIIKRTRIFLIARRPATFCNAFGLFLWDLRKIEFAIFLRRLLLYYESLVLVL